MTPTYLKNTFNQEIISKNYDPFPLKNAFKIINLPQLIKTQKYSSRKLLSQNYDSPQNNNFKNNFPEI